jgi:hypothetical protein
MDEVVGCLCLLAGFPLTFQCCCWFNLGNVFHTVWQQKGMAVKLQTPAKLPLLGVYLQIGRHAAKRIEPSLRCDTLCINGWIMAACVLVGKYLQGLQDVRWLQALQCRVLNVSATRGTQALVHQLLLPLALALYGDAVLRMSTMGAYSADSVPGGTEVLETTPTKPNCRDKCTAANLMPHSTALPVMGRLKIVALVLL